MRRSVAIAIIALAVLLGAGVGWGIDKFHGAGSGVNTGFKVGPRWFLVATQHAPTSLNPTTRLDLVEPSGALHAVATVPGNMSLVAWSGDGRRALVSGGLNAKSPAVTQVVDLTTGRTTTFSAGAARAIGFTRPDGLEVLALAATAAGRVDLERRSFSGGDPVTIAADVSADAAVVSTADGQALYVSQGKEIRLVSNLGKGPVTAVPSSTNCAPLRLWSSTELLAQCGGHAGRGRLEILPLAGGGARVVAKDTAHPLALNLEAYQVGSQVYTRTTGGCGFDWVSRVDSDGTTFAVTNNGGGPPHYNTLTSNGAELALVSHEGCESSSGFSLIWMNPSTFVMRTVLALKGGLRPTFLAFPTYDGVE